MAKILRLQENGTNTYLGWEQSSKYSTNAIKQINDPNGHSAAKQITSIPSPFARINLVKTAFEFVSQKDAAGIYPNLNTNTIYNKMVSDSLDVGQIFFDYEKHKNLVDIIVWDKQTDLQALHDGVPEHEQLARTYELFLQQDAQANNFNHLQAIYLLNYKQGPAPVNIIGATSPATLFFSSANDLSYVKIISGQDKFFDNEYMPLYRRDIEYHKFLWLLRISTPNFATLFPEFSAYLDACYTLSDSARISQLQSVVPNDFSQYTSISVAGNTGRLVEVLGIQFKSKIQNTACIADESDFVIQSTITQNKPLVLPVETFAQPYMYTTAIWDKTTKVPYVDNTPIDSRILPNEGAKYPYLTISDFLENTIIRIPYECNNSAYNDGNCQKKDGKTYLLPLKSLFFEYFAPNELQKMLELKDNAGGISVVLKIPVKGGSISYTRTYYDNAKANVSSNSNEGGIIECDFGFAMFPNVKFASSDSSFYRMGLVYDFNDINSYSIQCVKGVLPIVSEEYVRNNSDSRYPKCQVYAVDKQDFDYIQVTCNGKKGVIVPKFKTSQGSEQFTFAIDFGTTNTHIEYSVNGKIKSDEFSTSDDDIQIQPLAAYDKIKKVVFQMDLMPEFIGGKSLYNFPMRTALSEAKNTNWNSSISAYLQAGVAYTYEKLIEYQYNRILTNLKWSNDRDNIAKIGCYIDSLLILLRNKVVLNGGDLAQTKIVWFYPISMTKSRFNQFKKAWNDAYLKYFGTNMGNVVAMTESVAPYEFFKSSIGAVNRIVTIDIGGGTSDVVFAEDGKVQYITSFRFAANSIFGDVHDGAGVQNGIIRQFKSQIKDILDTNDESELIEVYDNLDGQNDSANLASFFFALKDNVKNKGISNSVNFNSILQNDESQKIVFLMFYTALIYHVAKIIKAKNLNEPRHIAFSGNGSKVISILTDDEKTLGKYTKAIFEKVLGKSYDVDGLDLKYKSDQPKEATCKGGISCKQPQDYDTVADMKVVLKTNKVDSFISDETYESINDSYIKQSLSETKQFLDSTFEIIAKTKAKDEFGIESNSISLAKDVCYRDLETYMKRALQQKKEEVDVTDPIEETLFFYPLNGMLNALAAEICDKR